MKVIILLSVILFGSFGRTQISESINVNPDTYLDDLKTELQKEWPKNRTINIVFHGHSVPAGFFKTPNVNTMGAYPNIFLKKLKEIYPYAVVNVIVTAIGGENSVRGAARFENDVLIHKPDVIFIDYALNDRGVELEKGRCELEGADLFVNVDEYVSRNEEEVLFEAHKKYAQINEISFHLN